MFVVSQPNQPPPDPTRERSSDGPPPSGGNAILVRYGAMRWVGEFACRFELPNMCGTRVVIQSDRGIELGEHVRPYDTCADMFEFRAQTRAYTNASGPEFCRPRVGRVLRRATEQDIAEHERLNGDTRQYIQHCAQLVGEYRLDMKIICAEHLLGGERIVFYFGAPARVDFRQLVRELAQHYRTRIEMRQVGARDEARLVADYEVCGRECCCKNFLKRLRPVNMKMAKLQKSTLDPSKVSGRCGRLRCCLRYEHLGYEELAARLPRSGMRVRIDAGIGMVVDQQILTQLVLVRMDDNQFVSVPLEEIREFNVPADAVAPPPPPPPPRAAPREPSAPPPAAAAPGAEPAPEGGAERKRRSRRRRRKPAGEGQTEGSAPASGTPRGERPPRAERPPRSENNGADGAAEPDGERRSESRRRRRRRPRRGPREGGSGGTDNGGNGGAENASGPPS